MFLYRITYLPSYQQRDRIRYLIRRSGKVFIKIPQSRMSQEMICIHRLGGTIISIKPLHNAGYLSTTDREIQVSQQDSSLKVKGIDFARDDGASVVSNNEILSDRGDNKLILAWWLEVFTKEPNCIYYFGPFDRLEDALYSQAEYIKELLDEGAKGISVQIKYCKPQKLTID